MSVEHRDVVVVGGGAAGFFGAITCAEALQGRGSVTILERGANVLQKVKISGGGRCNVTHSCFEPKELAKRYPRGGPALIGAFHRFQAADTVKWFEARGVVLKTEPDGRMFPTTDQSQTIVNCLTNAARDAGVELRTNCGVESVERRPEGGFKLVLATGQPLHCEALLLATGGCRAGVAGSLPVALGHTVVPPVPSLFTFHIADPRLEGIAGVAVPAEVSVPGTKLREIGPVLVTHWGLSGPGILRLSAWGARELAEVDYRFKLRVSWLPGEHLESVMALCQRQRDAIGARQVSNGAVGVLPGRLWEKLVEAAKVPREMKWSQLDRTRLVALARQLVEAEFAVTGKSMNKEEFVTCGGVRLGEVDFKTMASRVCPGLYFAGELLDIDGITGGFNFQAAWTTGWLAGNALAERLAAKQV